MTITLYAKWTLNTYTVSFNSNGGSSVASQTVAYNSTATLPSPPPTKNSYRFSTWYSDSGLTRPYIFSAPVVNSLTLYALWGDSVPLDSLKGFYSFAGNALDSSGNAYNGTIRGSITFVQDRFGKPNSAASFPGDTGSYIDCGNVFASSPAGLTQCVWIKTSVQRAAVLSKRQSVNPGVGWPAVLIINDSAYTYLDESNHTTVGPGISNVAINDNKWHFLCAIKNGNTYSLYVDAILQNAIGTDAITFTSTEDYTIGRAGTLSTYSTVNSYYYTGILDDVRIYSRALSANEILALYQAGGWSGN